MCMNLVKTNPKEYLIFIRPGIIDPWYRISKGRCKSVESFNKWIEHLKGKNWFTQDHAEAFAAAWKEGK